MAKSVCFFIAMILCTQVNAQGSVSAPGAVPSSPPAPSAVTPSVPPSAITFLPSSAPAPAPSPPSTPSSSMTPSPSAAVPSSTPSSTPSPSPVSAAPKLAIAARAPAPSQQKNAGEMLSISGWSKIVLVSGFLVAASVY
ncbi:hypothetical protein MPTK1_8g02350 [Marchantia polymorpha subsp. ruderalis]|uniref:Uncharacterized protein n=1 Tax=Marchantia polymorpha TaxID=3197 RepID=A0A2R6XIX3_MARPO|nr:hypothetical protein MARPO_0012s0032 [Marchantia polymorpha]PTQ46070.1 hypothetical protein MARPO_0012s0032 [Marchantia polymorpha]BBN18422.1 hypothetical protein Mp_8g02350 [Marchantia polymorpha subsp. ruderalis]BBN18423.1 hypothetical protein Mp_8g02350 [Marchantia polymorpha subsp. ruderalis]|eukprot:PTQ46069.1 hypothetical protein MARPO_0012s0032 [Marchantia polymorpha]